MGQDVRTKCQDVTTSQGLGHRHVLDQAFVRFGTTNVLVVPIEKESFMFPFSQGLFSSAGKMEIEGVVVEEVLVKFLNVFF
ncbi:hypothetical protein ACFX19_030218 [Malus domestica]